MNVQYVGAGNVDITDSPTARDDCVAIRVWDHEVLLVAMTEHEDGSWSVTASDIENVAGSCIPAGRRSALRIADKIMKSVRT